MQILFHIRESDGAVIFRNVYEGFVPSHATPPAGRLQFISENNALAEVEIERLQATVENGQVIAVAVNPDYVPPEPPVPLAEQIADLRARVDANLQVSPHDRRWLEQKEIAKETGLGFIKANPGCTIEEMETAIRAEVEAQLPGEPIVVSAGLILSYAVEAQKRGYIAEATWGALKALVVAATEKQLRQMLNKL